ncbi:hypothetical protein COU39_03505, partial [Candidatus Micrarchaeota archaeon CG10_big_fil_rev_8_21_14_0_10_60_32]
MAGLRPRLLRAQVDAPIELFVAIIVLMASMSLAFYLMQQTDEGKCTAQLRTETEKLQSAMLDVALASPPTSRTVAFEMPRCGKINVQILQFVYYSEPEYCRACPSHYGGCWQIIPVSIDRDGKYTTVSDAVSCIQMSGDMRLEADETCGALSGNPCPVDAPDCGSGVTGISSKVWNGNPEDSPSRWVTFGKQDTTVYRITLTKTTTLIGHEGEAGSIKICIRNAN